jgi:5-methylthioadenosine/S-adenosylhomocysteine deaminase
MNAVPNVPSPNRWLLRSKKIIPDAYSDPIENGGVLVEDGRVQSVGRFAAICRSYPLARVVEAEGDLTIPGLIDGHSHGRGMPLEAQGIDGVSLEQFFLRIPAMTELDPRDDALVAGADLLSTGVTTTQVNFHCFAKAEEYLEQASGTLGGLRDSEIRVTFVPCITEGSEFVPDTLLRSAPEHVWEACRVARRGLSSRDYFTIVEALYDGERADRSDAKVTFALGPCAPQWCSESTWARIGRMLTAGRRAQTHLLETRLQRSPTYGTPAVEKIVEAGAMSPRLSAAHGVWLTAEELDAIARSSVTHVHCPASNTRLGSGSARVRAWIDAGARVAFGLDSNSTTHPPDVFTELRHAAAVADCLGCPVTPRELFAMVTSGGGAAVGKESELGALRAGAMADLVSMSLPEHSARSGDPVEQLLVAGNRASINSVWVAGDAVVSRGEHVKAAEVARARRRLLDRLEADASLREARMRKLTEVDQWAQAQLALLDRQVARRCTKLASADSPRSFRRPSPGQPRRWLSETTEGDRNGNHSTARR